jgi:hypothetical protein
VIGEEKENVSPQQKHNCIERFYTIRHSAIQNPSFANDNVITDRIWESVINYTSSILRAIDRARFVSTNAASMKIEARITICISILLLLFHVFISHTNGHTRALPA